MLSDKVLAAYNKQILLNYTPQISTWLWEHISMLLPTAVLETGCECKAKRNVGTRCESSTSCVDRGGDVDIQSIEATSARFESPVAVFEQVLAQEREVTRMFHDLSISPSRRATTRRSRNWSGSSSSKWKKSASRATF